MADQTLRVMLAEDNPVNQTLLRHLLESLGHAVTVAEHGASALELVATEDFDVALMDMQMPVMDGETATRLIRMLPGERASLPVLALTADCPTENGPRFAAAGVTAVLPKPITLAQLAQALRTVTGAPSAAPAVPDLEEGEAQPVLDPTYLEDMRQWVGNEALQALLATAPDSFRAELAAIQAGWTAGDLRAVRENAHRLKGAAGSVGCRRLADAAQVLQKIGAITPDGTNSLERLRAETMAAIDATATWTPT